MAGQKGGGDHQAVVCVPCEGEPNNPAAFFKRALPPVQSINNPASNGISRGGSALPRKLRTCRHWLAGRCTRGRVLCDFLHAYTDPAKKGGLCLRALTGECDFTASGCFRQHLPIPLDLYELAASGTGSFQELSDKIQDGMSGARPFGVTCRLVFDETKQSTPPVSFLLFFYYYI